MEYSPLEELIVTQLVKKSPPFMKPEGLLPSPQNPATSPDPEPDESSQRPPNLRQTHFNIITPIKTTGKIIILYILEVRQEDNRLRSEW
jgi:hypothetical protein